MSRVKLEPWEKQAIKEGPRVHCDVCGEIRICRRIKNDIGDILWVCHECPSDVRWEEK